MYTLKDILKTKGKDVWSVSSQASVLEALRIMTEKNIGAILVMDEGKLAGIFSERDYARETTRKKLSILDTPVADLMQRDVYCMKHDTPVEKCMELMTGQRIRHVPVMVNERLAGIVSIGDVVKLIITDQEFRIQQLEKYIVSG